ncbi:MAG: metallophosphoesterase family protein [Myxococcota bacterium]
MLSFSQDPQVAERQMHAIIFYLTTFGYIDGDFDASEKEFVRNYIRKLVEHRVKTGMPKADAAMQRDLVQRFTTHFHEVFEGIDAHVRDLFTEAVARDEDQDAFVHAKLKQRCFEIFQSFDRPSQEMLMDTIDDLIEADGQVHPAEVKFRGELAELVEADLEVELVDDAETATRVQVNDPADLRPVQDRHPFFDQFEFHYSADPDKLLKQVSADRELIDRAIQVFDEQKRAGAGKLDGKQTVGDLTDEGPFLDGHVYWHPAEPGKQYELTVLGDLHGCYSNLKAASLQTTFFDKVAAYRKDPTLPKPLLVLLGDYIDRGLFSLNGVLRTVLQMLVTAPEHVYVLRGNHEYYVEYKGQIFGGVKPAEAINTLKPHLPIETFRSYIRLFDAMPNMLLFDRHLFVHAGIPRDRLVKERWKDLSTLNEWDVRFQMMWSDPSSVDVIPAELQEQSARFPFGRLQATAFLQRLGCHTLVRGHEKVNEGFRRTYDDGNILLITLFSAGGLHNEDLPVDSSYRSVTPMGMTLEWNDGDTRVLPWRIDYEHFNDPDRNAFFKAPPELQHRAD